MNLCLVCNQYPPLPIGGHGSRTSVLAPALVARGHKVTVVGVVPRNVSVKRDCEEVIAGVRVVRLTPYSTAWRYRPSEWLSRWKLSRWIHRAHKTERFDLVDCVDSDGWMCFGAPKGVPLTTRFAATSKL